MFCVVFAAAAASSAIVTDTAYYFDSKLKTNEPFTKIRYDKKETITYILLYTYDAFLNAAGLYVCICVAALTGHSCSFVHTHTCLDVA